MGTELVEVQPQELKFVFETKKQSSCAIQLISNSDQYVAFKVKTTSPKKYCVRPNIGVIKPKETCDFTVTMQAQRTAPLDFQCRDKFLIQSTIVPFGVTEEDITSEMFARDSGKYIEDKKLKVILVSPPNSPILPVSEVLKQGMPDKIPVKKEKEMGGMENIPSSSPVLQPVNGVLNQDRSNQISVEKVKEMGGVEKPYTFARDSGKYIEDKKLKGILVSPPNSPILPVSGVLKQDMPNKIPVKKEKEMGGMENIPSFSPVLQPVNGVFSQDRSNQISVEKVKEMGGVEKPYTVSVGEGFKFVRDTDESRATNIIETIPNKGGEEELKLAKNVVNLKLAKDVEDMKLNLNAMQANLNEAELRITKLTLERSEVTKEKEMLKQELEMLRQKSSVRTVQVGFPFLFVVMVSLISLALGRYMHL